MLTGQWTLALSASYGGIAVVLPVTVMIWGMTAGRLTRLLSVFAKSSFLALVFWEGVKLVLSVLMLALAPVVLKNLNWLALVAGFVLVIKVYWLALFVQSKTS
jgi:ATP synthase protein I